ncbi:hypothetical protein MSG28_004256 [Choristoneura fumiferana]|uniref:Uncharacterized protein n=1 Tax=Choristoneura fumiferana TaxID=7141 RepID=A0ACC0KI52_CHOFU|nr:hypothetical protein MSG28_004256 [Choristoneura fumiferana]
MVISRSVKFSFWSYMTEQGPPCITSVNKKNGQGVDICLKNLHNTGKRSKNAEQRREAKKRGGETSASGKVVKLHEWKNSPQRTPFRISGQLKIDNFMRNIVIRVKNVTHDTLKLWNDLPLSLRESPSVASFRESLKKLWLDTDT